MDSKYDSESNDDGVKKERDRYHHNTRKKDYSRHRGDSDSSDSNERNRSKLRDRKDERGDDDDRTRVRISEKDERHKYERWQSEDERKKASHQSPNETCERFEKDKGRKDRDRDSKYDCESNDDGVKKERDRYHLNTKKKDSRPHRHHRDESDSSDSNERYKHRLRERKDECGGVDDDRTRVRISEKHEGHRHERWQSKDERKNASRQSPAETCERLEKEKSRKDRDRWHEGENRHRKQETRNLNESYQSSDDDEARERRHKREKGAILKENNRKRHETENGNKNRDRDSYRDSKDEQDKELHGKLEHRRNWTDNDKHRKHSKYDYDHSNTRQHQDVEMTELREDRRSIRDKEKAVGGALDHPQPQKQEKQPDGNLNSDVSNLGKSGGVYIPPFKLARMMKEVQDKSSVEYQRLTWDALRKSINGLVNKVNATNIKNIIPELFAENLIRGRGLFCRSCMKSQMASPGFTDVFAALVAVVNTKFPEVGDLLLRRIVLQLKRAYKRNDKPQLLAAVKFVAHLVNQQVAHEIIALELLTVLLENPTDDSVEVAVGFVTECGSLLQDLSPKGLHGIFERFRGILHEGEIDKRVQFLIEGLFAIRKAKFEGYPAVRPELDLVEQEDQLTHEISLQEEIDSEIALDIFKPDSNFLDNEKRYEDLKKNILGEESGDEDQPDAGSDEDEDDDDDDEEDESEEEDEEQMKINDETETDLVNLRRTIYLTIMSSVDFEEAGHKLLKIKLEPGQEMELCIMLLECCSQERTYLRYYGLLGQRFCMINRVHQENFEHCFVQQYSMIHRLETNKLRNVAKFFAHLLGTFALPWHVLAYIRLTEEDTTSSSRIFIKILFQELSEHLGIRLLNERLTDPTMQDSFESIFPKDNPKNTRFSINFFTSIGLGGLTENLREYLKNMPRLIMQQQKPVSESDEGSGSSGSSESETSSSESESDSSSSEESDRKRGKRRRTKK